MEYNSHPNGGVATNQTRRRIAGRRRARPRYRMVSTRRCFQVLVSVCNSKLLFAAFVAYAVFISLSYATAALKSIEVTLCSTPGISLLPICRREQPASTWADLPYLSRVQSATFGELLDETAGSTSLSLEIKKAEMATADLATIVRTSKLRTRDALADTLASFVADARLAATGLVRLRAKISVATDSILAVNGYTLELIEAAHHNRLPFPFSKRISPDEGVITMQAFAEAMKITSLLMEALVLEASISVSNLNALEERLSVLSEKIALEDIALSEAKSELLSLLWTQVGGNRKSLRGYESHLNLLINLASHKTIALAHVVATLEALMTMSHEMDELRKQVAAPNLWEHIPTDVYIRSIEVGIGRLGERGQSIRSAGGTRSVAQHGGGF